MIYHVFGLRLGSELPFGFRLSPAPPGSTDLIFEVSPLPLSPSYEAGEAIYTSPLRFEDGESLARLYRSGESEVFSFSRTIEFHLRGDRITAGLLAPEAAPLVEIRLFGPVLSYCLERRGIPALHASAAEVHGRAVGFLSAEGGGKTGFAAAMIQAGHPLLTDDILPVEEKDGVFFGRSGYPQMRMWPDEAAHFLGAFEHLPLVHPDLSKRRAPVGDGWGSFHEPSLPLACLYVAQRREGGAVEIQPMTRREAVIELVRHSFSPHLVEAVGLQPARLDLFARLVRSVPVRRLLYPSGFELLPRVVDALLADLRSA